MDIKFHYIAAGKDGSRQNGSLFASSEPEARAKLHSMGFSVLKLNKDFNDVVVEKKSPEADIYSDGSDYHDNISYEFSGLKASGEEVDGTIEAKNDITAFKRLCEEYKFNINWLVEKDLSPAVKEHKKKGSVERILSEAFDEGISIKYNDTKSSSFIDLSGYASREEKDAVEEDVKKYTSLVKGLYKNCNGVISGVDLNNIQKQISELEKIQKSNNLALIQSELEDLLVKVSGFFNEKNKEDLPYKALSDLKDISLYIGVSPTEVLVQKIFLLLGKFSFLKEYIDKFKKYSKEKEEKHKDYELIQKRANLVRYIRRFFHHLKLYILSKDKNDRKRRLVALKKTLKLIISTYKTYSVVKGFVDENRAKYSLEFEKTNIGLYQEFRFISSLVLIYYFVYFLFIDFGLRKGIFFNYKFAYFTLSSDIVLTLLLGAFLINFLSLIKINFFLRSISFNLFFGTPFFLFFLFFYYINY